VAEKKAIQSFTAMALRTSARHTPQVTGPRRKDAEKKAGSSLTSNGHDFDELMVLKNEEANREGLADGALGARLI